MCSWVSRMMIKGLKTIKWGLNNVFLSAFVHTSQHIWVIMCHGYWAKKIWSPKGKFWLELIHSHWSDSDKTTECHLALITLTRSSSSANLLLTYIKSVSVWDSWAHFHLQFPELPQVITHLSASDRLSSSEEYQAHWSWILNPYFLDMAGG